MGLAPELIGVLQLIECITFYICGGVYMNDWPCFNCEWYDSDTGLCPAVNFKEWYLCPMEHEPLEATFRTKGELTYEERE